MTNESLSGADFFKKPGDLGSENVGKTNYFRVAGDIEKTKSNAENVVNKKNITIEEIKDYLSAVVSGKKFDYECELGTLCSGGQIMVSFSALKQMVADGYNIISATCLSPDMIMVEFQQYKKDKTNSFGK